MKLTEMKVLVGLIITILSTGGGAVAWVDNSIDAKTQAAETRMERMVERLDLRLEATNQRLDRLIEIQLGRPQPGSYIP